MSSKRDYYEILGVDRTADEGQIKRAYFAKVRKFPPERFPQEFMEIREAYETLTHPEKRDEWERLSSISPAAAALMQKAVEALEDDKPGNAAKYLEKLCKLEPNVSDYHLRLGNAYDQRSWNRKAIEQYRIAIKLDERNAEAWVSLGTAYMRTNENNMVRNTYKEANAAVQRTGIENIRLLTSILVVLGDEECDAQAYLYTIERLLLKLTKVEREEHQDAVTLLFTRCIAAEHFTWLPALERIVNTTPSFQERFQKYLNQLHQRVEIAALSEKGFHPIFTEFFELLINEEIDVDDEDTTGWECTVLAEVPLYRQQIQRLQQEFPNLYSLHTGFFDEVLRTNNAGKMMSSRIRKLRMNHSYPSWIEDAKPEQAVVRTTPKVGRNEPCPCGSGRKYKHCCGA